MTDATQDVGGFYHPSRRPYRFTVLLFVGLLPFGSYFAYDSIGAMAPTLMQAWHTDQSAIGGMYTIYSIAAILCVLLAGLGHHEHRRLKAVGVIETLAREVKTRIHVMGNQDNMAGIAMGGAIHQRNIGLLGARRQPGGRSAALDINDHQRDLGHHAPADAFTLE